MGTSCEGNASYSFVPIFLKLCICFFMYGCACGLGKIVRTFLWLFLHCELCHFSPSIYRQWVPLVRATPLTVLYRSFWNFAYVFSCMAVHVVWVKLLELFCDFFYIVNFVIFHPQYIDNGYLLWGQRLLQFCTNHFETLHVFFMVWLCMWFG